MPRKNQQLSIKARDGRGRQPVKRVELVKVECDRCGSTVYADADGGPRSHLRPTRPGEPLHSEIVPTMTECAD
jgi:hypothetical protein